MYDNDATSGGNIRYYDWTRMPSATTTGQYAQPGFSNSSPATVTTTGMLNPYQVRYIVQQMYVTCPEHWTVDDSVALAAMLRDDVQVGWQITAIIQGDILILDPNIPVRSMMEFKQMIWTLAISRDRETIASFFKIHTIEKPD